MVLNTQVKWELHVMILFNLNTDGLFHSDSEHFFLNVRKGPLADTFFSLNKTFFYFYWWPEPAFWTRNCVSHVKEVNWSWCTPQNGYNELVINVRAARWIGFISNMVSQQQTPMLDKLAVILGVSKDIILQRGFCCSFAFTFKCVSFASILVIFTS